MALFNIYWGNFQMKLRSRTLSAWLALLLGGVGAHWFYLQGSRGWRPWIYLMLLPTGLSILAGFAEAIRFGLMSDQHWHVKFNPDFAEIKPHSGGLPVLAAILGLSAATIALMTLCAIVFQWLASGRIA